MIGISAGLGAVSEYKNGVVGRGYAARMTTGTAEGGSYRYRPGEAPWEGQFVPAGPLDRLKQNIAAGFQAVLRMILPVTVLVAAFLGLFLYLDTSVPLFPDDGGQVWLTASHLLLPVGFLCVFLTNRRYGPGYAFAQVVISGALVVAFVMFAAPDAKSFVRFDLIPAMREALAFGTAFFIASFISIVVFDGTRGPSWWTAPLFGFITAAIFFALIFYPLAYAGTGTHWLGHGFTYMSISLGEGLLLMIPYFMLRRVVPPLSGFGGY